MLQVPAMTEKEAICSYLINSSLKKRIRFTESGVMVSQKDLLIRELLDLLSLKALQLIDVYLTCIETLYVKNAKSNVIFNTARSTYFCKLLRVLKDKEDIPIATFAGHLNFIFTILKKEISDAYSVTIPSVYNDDIRCILSRKEYKDRLFFAEVRKPLFSDSTELKMSLHINSSKKDKKAMQLKEVAKFLNTGRLLTYDYAKKELGINKTLLANRISILRGTKRDMISCIPNIGYRLNS